MGIFSRKKVESNAESLSDEQTAELLLLIEANGTFTPQDYGAIAYREQDLGRRMSLPEQIAFVMERRQPRSA